MKGCKLILLFLFCCIISITLSAQDREQLEQERMQVIESIEATDDLIASSEADRQKGIATLVALRGQIDQRNTLLNNIKQSISAAEFEIEFNLATLDSLTQRVKSIKDQYAILLLLEQGLIRIYINIDPYTLESRHILYGCFSFL